MSHPRQPDHNDLAIASLVLGILSLAGMGPLTGIPAVITGWMSLKNPTSRGMSLAGIITGSISIVLTLLIGIAIFLVLMLGLFAASSVEIPHSDGSSEPSGSGFYQQQA